MTEPTIIKARSGEQETGQPPLTAHPLYQQVEVLIHQGNWFAAQAPLVQLIALYPDDEYLRELAHSVRTRTVLLGDQEGSYASAERASKRSHRLRIVTLSLIAFTLLCVVAGGITFALWGWILPSLQEQRQAAEINQLEEEARNALDSGDYDRAVLAYNEILDLQPGDEKAQAGLAQADQLRATASLYSEAIIEMEAHHWDKAQTILQQIQSKQPGYRDVADRINFIQQQQDLLALFNKAEAAFNQANYELAIQSYEELQGLNSNFQSDLVQSHLFLSYLQLGLAQEEAAGSNPQKLQEALYTLEKALALRPDDSQVRGETQLIRLYSSGLKELKAKNWSQATADLGAVYEARPDFAAGTIGQYLFEAYLAWGDELYAQEQYEEALAKYDAASVINEGDKTDLIAKITLVEVALTPPTPTPTPIPAQFAPAVASLNRIAAPTATPVPSPYTLKGMSVRNNCSGNGYIHGVVWNAYGMPLSGISVHAFNTTTGAGPFVSNPTNPDGIYQIVLNGDQIPGLWMVQILDEHGQPASEAWGQRLGGECLNGAQELKVDWQRALQIGE